VRTIATRDGQPSGATWEKKKLLHSLGASSGVARKIDDLLGRAETNEGSGYVLSEEINFKRKKAIISSRGKLRRSLTNLGEIVHN